jgi:two-component system phosphate regulon sensor histidine kinase PhoR
LQLILGAAIIVIVALLFLLWRMKKRADAEADSAWRHESRLSNAERERSVLDEKLTALTRVTSEGIVQVDAEGYVTYMNDTARALLEVTDGPDRPLIQLAWGYDLHPLVKQVLEESGGGVVSQTVVRGERAFTVRAVSFQDVEERGALLGIAEVSELQRLGRVRREFVANISHELRTPVTSLLLLSETLNQDVLHDKALMTDIMTKMRAQVELLKQLTDELMDLALIESGQAPIRLVTVFASELINDSLAALRPQIERKRITLETHIPPDMEVLADPQAIRKVINNLTHNALKYTPDHGHITVRAVWKNDGADVEISIQDDGIGIPAKDLPRIFERFYKVDRARTRAQGDLRGTGLGLAISRHIVEAHGGKIWAESSEGKGSTFYFTLPSGE